LSFPARLEHAGTATSSVEIRDVSATGVFVATNAPTLPFRSIITLLLDVRGAPVELKGEVVHVVDAEGAKRMNHEVGYGVQLINPPADLLPRFLAADADPTKTSDDRITPDTIAKKRKRAEEHPTVLIIDDDIRVAKALVRTMAMIHLPAVWEDSGTRGRRRFLAHRESIRVMIVDALLPDASGADLIEEFRAKSPNLGIVAISGLLRTNTARRAFMQAGADDYLKKPFHPEEICDVVKRLLRNQGKNAA